MWQQSTDPPAALWGEWQQSSESSPCEKVHKVLWSGVIAVTLDQQSLQEVPMAGRNFLFVPGPTNVPDRVLRAMVVAMEDHRSSKFPELTKTLFPDLRKLFRSATGQVFIFPSTGTGAWEASLVNTLSPGDKVLAPRFGQFSHLWIEMMKRLGLDVQVIEVEWGEGAPVEKIGEILAADTAHAIKGVMIVH